MSRRQTLGALSPGQLNSRPSGAGGNAARNGKQEGRQSLKPSSGRPSVVPWGGSEQQNAGASGFDRRSSAFGKGAASAPGVKQDPRPLGNKEFFASCIRTVITYLSSRGYPYAISPKLLASPTGKDFAQVGRLLRLDACSCCRRNHGLCHTSSHLASPSSLVCEGMEGEAQCYVTAMK